MKKRSFLKSFIIFISIFFIFTALEKTFLNLDDDQKNSWLFSTFIISWLFTQAIKELILMLKPKPYYIVVKIGYGGQVTNLIETKNLNFAKELAAEWHKKDPEKILDYLDYAVLRKTDDEYVFFSSSQYSMLLGNSHGSLKNVFS